MLRFLIVFLFLARIGFGQDEDTLLTHFLKIENDTERVNQLYKKGLDLVDKNPRLAFQYAQYCESEAQKTKSLTHLSKSYNLSGILFYKQGYFKKAIASFEKYLSANKLLNNVLGIGYSFTNLANSYLQLKQFQKAEEYYLLAIQYYNTLNTKTEIANGLINLGVLKQEQKQLEAAEQNYEKALQTGKELNDYTIKAICLNNLAQVFLDKGDFEKALAYNYDALELRELMGLDVDISDSYLSIAEVALKQNDLNLAEEHLNLAINLCNQLDYYEGKMVYHKLVSEFYSKKNNYQLAYENLKKFNQLNDSLMHLMNAESVDEFEELVEPLSNCNANPIKNVWLLILLSLTLIIIPFVLIRYKR